MQTSVHEPAPAGERWIFTSPTPEPAPSPAVAPSVTLVPRRYAPGSLIVAEGAVLSTIAPEYTDEAIRKAFYMAKLESRPIMLSAPMDVQQAKFEDDDPYVPSSTLFASGGLARPDEAFTLARIRVDRGDGAAGLVRKLAQAGLPVDLTRTPVRRP